MDYSKYSKPFPSYRWRWGALTPTENLNLPEVYFGCLQVLYRNQGKSPSSTEVHEGLKKIERDLSSLDIPTLARSKERNIFRNSGQYWKITGLLRTTKAGIKLTPFGDAYATGKITRDEFSAYTIKNVKYPNIDIDDQNIVNDWVSRNLTIKPLELILNVIVNLYATNKSSGYLTTEELTHVVIPMSGHGERPPEISAAIIKFRNDPSLFKFCWVANDGTNDSRIARELLLFLKNYDYLGVRDATSLAKNKTNIYQEFFLYDEQYESILSLLDIRVDDFELNGMSQIETAIAIDKKVQATDSIRERKFVEIISRPSQARFRKDVMEAGSYRCLLSGVTIKESLQACHIIPVKNNGSDHRSNGLLLRADLHTLYDKGHIKIIEDGTVFISEYLKTDPYYSINLPRSTELPSYVNLDAIRIRNEYSM